MSISVHPHPHAGTQRVISWIIALVLAATIMLSLAMIVIAFVFEAWLTLCSIPFLLGLTAPLLLRTALHPQITVEEKGLRLQPLLWQSVFIAWEDLEGPLTHTLLKPESPRRLARLDVTPHEGMMVHIARGWHWQYRVVSFFAGYGWKPVFGISNRSHLDYDTLRKALKKHLREDGTP